MDRHLLPEEIDQLLDGEVGFGTAPLKTHIRVCAACRAELESARALVRQLEHLAYLAPSGDFAGRVLSQIQIFVPWYVTALDTVRGWLPRSRAWRTAALAGFATTAAALTIVSLWILARLDTVLFAVDMGLDRVRAVILGAMGDVVSSLFGDTAVHALRSTGALGVWIALTALLLATAFAARALRAVVGGARR